MPPRVTRQRLARIPTVHGGDVDRVARAHGVSADRLIDFSANINPVGPPRRALIRLAREATDRRVLTQYPDPDYVELRTMLATTLSVPANGVTIANGSVALIAAMVRAIAPRACVLATPAFAEYPRALRASGCQVRLFPLAAARGFALESDALLKTLKKYRPAVCVLTNPHNPSGALTARSDMLRVLDGARRTKTLMVIDEAFIDYAPAETVVAEAVRSEYLVVLRSVTKFYGMPALRVGYAVSSPPGRQNHRAVASVARDDAGRQCGDGGGPGSRVCPAHLSVGGRPAPLVIGGAGHDRRHRLPVRRQLSAAVPSGHRADVRTCACPIDRGSWRGRPRLPIV